ncbi:MAG: hypothetical protein PHR73_01825 [Candidatus Omnitrophica bacterium]|nr:hypothetical protein [Candidatus Omnitrophota bacterium]
MKNNELTDKEASCLFKENNKFRMLMKSIVLAQIEGLIRSGEINPKGKSISNLLREAGEIILKAPNAKFMSVIDYTEDILREARIFKKKRSYYFSCIFYAAWVEHWINGVIADECIKLKLEEKYIKEIIKDISIKNKYAWLLVILRLPNIPERMIKFIEELVQIRNSFIHYKWERKDIDDVERDEKERESCKRKINNFEKVVRYLKKYEERHLLKNYKREVSKNMKISI